MGQVAKEAAEGLLGKSRTGWEPLKELDETREEFRRSVGESLAQLPGFDPSEETRRRKAEPSKELIDLETEATLLVLSLMLPALRHAIGHSDPDENNPKALISKIKLGSDRRTAEDIEDMRAELLSNIDELIRDVGREESKSISRDELADILGDMRRAIAEPGIASPNLERTLRALVEWTKAQAAAIRGDEPVASRKA